MARAVKRTRISKQSTQSQSLKGWQQIAEFLSHPVSVAQRWTKTVTRQERFVTARPEELNKWLGQEAGGEPLHLAIPEADLSAELKRGLAYVRSAKRHSVVCEEVGRVSMLSHAARLRHELSQRNSTYAKPMPRVRTRP